MPTFTSETNPSDFSVYVHRADYIYLNWCKQVFDLIEQNFPTNTEFSINDIGCCYGQLLKELKQRNYSNIVSYRGFDIDNRFLELAHTVDPLALFQKLDIESNVPPLCDVTICAGLLEHVDNKETSIDNIFNSTSKAVILRTFSGEEDIFHSQDNPDITPLPYNIDQLSMQWIEDQFKLNGFSHQVVTDSATENSKLMEIHSGSRIYRRFHIHMGFSQKNKSVLLS